ncbi:bifunctional hydroxymethylpyrimidine kinase/phosphomethylpyrimidine kinase, partial [Listeria monocytogenes]
KGNSLLDSVVVAKEFITSAIKYPLGIGHGHGPTNHFAYRMEDGK